MSTAPPSGEPGLLYLEASVDGQIEKIFGDRAWLPIPLKAYESTIAATLPALEGAQGLERFELDFVEIAPNVFIDIQYQFDGGRQFVWLRNTSRHAEHLRAAQQVANSRALREAISSRWLDDIYREHSHVRALLDAIAVPIAYWSTQGTLAYCNDSFAAAAGVLPAALQGQRADAAIFGDLGLPIESVSGQAQAGAYRRAGRATPSRITPDRAPSGEVAGFLDVTV